MSMSEPVKLCQLVELHECLYNYNCPEYSKRDVTEKAWAEIAIQMNDTASHCKEKWKNLRTAFSRSMKSSKRAQAGGGAKSSRVYYLQDALQFVIPYMKAQPRSGKLPSNETTDSDSETQVCENVQAEYEVFGDTPAVAAQTPQKRPCDDADDNSFETPDGDGVSTPAVGRSTKRQQSTLKLPASKRLGMQADRSFIEYVNSKKSSLSESPNPDLEFLKSLLPDISTMTSYQKRQFKRRTLGVIDDILNDAP